MKWNFRYFIATIIFFACPPVFAGLTPLERMAILEKKTIQQQEEIYQLEKKIDDLTVKKKEAPAKPKVKSKKISKKKEEPKKPENLVFTDNSAPIKVKLTGLVNQVMFYANDGKRNRLFFGNNASGDTRVRVTGTAPVTSEIDVFGTMEISVKNNTSDKVNQDTQFYGDFLGIRIAEIGFDSKHFGKAYLGQGPTATDYTAESDLSGTYAIITYSGVQFIGGGLIFNNASTGDLTGPTVNESFNNIDGLGRRNRLRYDTPKFGGLYLGISAITDGQGDISLKFDREFSNNKILASLGYASTNNLSDDITGTTLVGSGSILFKNGFNFTIAGGQINTTESDRENPYYYYFKPGYQAKLNHLGNTNFVADFGMFNNFNQNDDRGRTYSFAVLQRLADWNVDLYAGWRIFILHRTDVDFDDINEVIVGGKINFY